MQSIDPPIKLLRRIIAIFTGAGWLRGHGFAARTRVRVGRRSAAHCSALPAFASTLDPRRTRAAGPRRFRLFFFLQFLEERRILRSAVKARLRQTRALRRRRLPCFDNNQSGQSLHGLLPRVGKFFSHSAPRNGNRSRLPTAVGWNRLLRRQ